MTRKLTLVLLLIAFVSVALRPPIIGGDSDEYLNGSHLWLEKRKIGGYLNVYHDIFPPLYTLTLAGLRWLTGDAECCLPYR